MQNEYHVPVVNHYQYNAIDSNDTRVFGRPFGRFGFGRPFGFGYGRPYGYYRPFWGAPFVGGVLGGLLAGSLAYPYPFGYPYPYYPFYPYY